VVHRSLRDGARNGAQKVAESAALCSPPVESPTSPDERGRFTRTYLLAVVWGVLCIVLLALFTRAYRY